LEKHAGDVAGLVEALDIHKFCLVGMSLGGLSAISYAGHHSTNLAGLVLVDVGPRTREAGTDRIKNFMAQPAELDSVEDFVERAMSFNPARDPVLLRQSLLHNLHQLPNGKWTWKYDRRHRVRPDLDTLEEQREGLWADVSSITCPTLIARGARSDVFTDEDASELAGMFPQARWVRVDRAGHTVQGDNPLGLIEVMTPFLEKLPWSS
jgi:pimeloyl-ACP methyl ester carboxylesterase